MRLPSALLSALLVLSPALEVAGCARRQHKDVRSKLRPRSGMPACYLLPLKNYKTAIAQTTKPFGTCHNSTVTILVDGSFRCVQLATGRLTRRGDAMTCPDDGVLYMYGLNQVIGTALLARKAESAKKFVCYQLRRPERDPLFWRTHLEQTELGAYYCRALYGFGTARIAIYLVSDPENVKHGFCFFAGGVSDMLRTVSPQWCQMSVGGVVAFKAWKR